LSRPNISWARNKKVGPGQKKRALRREKDLGGEKHKGRKKAARPLR